MSLLFVTWLLSAAPVTGVLSPCPVGPEATEAQRLLDRVDLAAFRTKDAQALKAAWEAVQAHRCFALPLHETGRRPPDDDLEAFAAWWDRGGREWLAAGLARDDAFAVVPPDAPQRVERGKERGLARLACAPQAPATCARETAGWEMRAVAEFEPRPSPHDSTQEAIEADCAGEAKKAAKPQAYRAWRQCLERRRPTASALPFGHFRAPSDGWLVLRGRRGHYQFCDEVRAYDLATGAAWVAQSCSGLALTPEGPVDHDATDARRSTRVQVGRLPVEALREAAWMTLLSAHVVSTVQSSAWYVRRPPGLIPIWPAEDAFTVQGIGIGDLWVSSAQTRLAWSWQGKDGLRDSGTLTWPNSSTVGENYTDQLWRIAEAAFLEGCAPARPPAPLVVGDDPGVSHIDAKRASLDAAERTLLDALFAHGDGCADAGT